jgi:RHS repeat-associated protein
LTVSNVYDSVLRRTTNGLWNGTSWLAQTRYSYDAASRLATVSGGTNTAGYSYVANSPLVSEIDFTNSTTRRMVTTKAFDLLNRLTNITSSAGATTVASFGYQYNDANQRTSVTNADGSYIVYSYNSLGQVTAGNKYWSDGTPVAGQQFNYAFDDIGNRTSTAVGGDEYGANLRSATYAANSLNQYTNRTVPGYINVLGSANTNATVSIWGSDGSYSATSRKGTYYRGELSVDNSANALWLTITNVAVLTNGGSPDIVTNTIGNAFLPQTAESFLYDLDGNLTVDGRWTNSWNGENRLIGMVCQTNAAGGSKLRLSFGYDYRARRISKQVETWSGSAWSVTLSNKFVYDGWNLIAELNGTNNAIIRSYTWGMDLSGSVQGAGGVGGLLQIQNVDLGTQNFVAFDGNGNVAGLVKATEGTLSAKYEYGPFGEVIKASGIMAKANPVRFSTKCQDDETDLVYYGYRYYNSSMGRWVSGDPLGDHAFRLSMSQRKTGIEIKQFYAESLKPRYFFVANNPESEIDAKGLNVYKVTLPSSVSGSIVNHREIVGDDGTNGCYVLEFYAKNHSGCRCFGAAIVAPGQINVQFIPRTSAADYIKQYNFNVVGSVESSNVRNLNGLTADEELAAKATGFSTSDPGTYILLFDDCGTIANSWLKLAQAIVNQMQSPSLPGGGFPY